MKKLMLYLFVFALYGGLTIVPSFAKVLIVTNAPEEMGQFSAWAVSEKLDVDVVTPESFESLDMTKYDGMIQVLNGGFIFFYNQGLQQVQKFLDAKAGRAIIYGSPHKDAQNGLLQFEVKKEIVVEDAYRYTTMELPGGGDRYCGLWKDLTITGGYIDTYVDTSEQPLQMRSIRSKSSDELRTISLFLKRSKGYLLVLPWNLNVHWYDHSFERLDNKKAIANLIQWANGGTLPKKP